MFSLLAAVLIGLLAGLRPLTPPAVLSWADHVGDLPLEDTPLAFLGWRFTPWILSLLAIGELVADKLPRTPARTRAVPFVVRILAGALCGAAVGYIDGQHWLGLGGGVLGAVLGTFGGAAARAWLAAGFGRDLPAALLEDAVAIGGAILLALWMP